MDFETMLILKGISLKPEGLTTEECRSFATDFFDSCYEGQKRVGGITMKLEQAGLVSKKGLPARYSVTDAGREQLSEFQTGVLRYVRKLT